MNTAEKSLKSFRKIIIAVAVLGAGLAIVADSPKARRADGYWDAAREIGGALIAGAIVAGLVLWFEERREDDRVDREEKRDQRQFDREEARADEAAQAAWRRDLDFQLVRLIHSDLATVRHQRLAAIHDTARRHEGQTHTPVMVEDFRSASDRTSSDLIVRQIIAILNLIPMSPARVQLQGAVMRWNSNDYEAGSSSVITPMQFSKLQNIEDKHWTEVTDRLDDYLPKRHNSEPCG